MRNVLSKKDRINNSYVIPGVIVFVILIIFFRLLLDQYQWSQKADKSLQANEFVKAIAYNDRVIQSYIPFSPYVEKARHNLVKISNYAHKYGDDKLARVADETLKSGDIYTQNIFSGASVKITGPGVVGVFVSMLFFMTYIYSISIGILRGSIRICSIGVISLFIWYVSLALLH